MEWIETHVLLQSIYGGLSNQSRKICTTEGRERERGGEGDSLDTHTQYYLEFGSMVASTTSLIELQRVNN